MSLGLWAIGAAAFGGESAAPFPSTGTETDGGIVGSTDPETVEAPPAKPAWLVRAERLFEEGVLAETAGKPKEARKKYARTLRVLADGADDATMLELRPEISSFLHLAGRGSSGVAGDLPRDPELLAGTEGWDAARKEVGIPADAADGGRADAAFVGGGPRPSTHSYTIPVDAEDPNVKKFLALYSGPLHDRTQAAFDRMGRYMDFVTRAIAEERLPRELVYLPVVESEYQNFAVSRAGAEGMWQFMGATARYAGLKVNYWVDERRDPEKATRAALKTLKSLYDWFDDWSLALAAYNRGLYGIQRDLEFTRSTDFSLLAKRQGVPVETELYVPKLMALVILGDNAAAYGFRPPRPSSEPPPDSVTLERPLDLKVAAACAGVPESTIRDLNPSLRLWVTPTNESNFTLKIPAGSKERFLAELAKVKDWTPSPGTVRYTVQKGDILGRIAARFRTTASAIQRENKLPNSNRLRPGQKLVIRPGRGFKGD